MSGVMFQGTASNVGKSLIVAGVCRVLTQDGFDVVPFKPQNMSLNSYIDDEGKEMGRAQVFQAIASNKVPRAYMNPILLKPCGNHISQVIFCGEVVANMESRKYQEYKKSLVAPLCYLYRGLEDKHDVVVMEGAGSPAEININSLDISNMKMAEIANCPVILVADIDRGGVFASIVGTLNLLNEEDRARVKGVIINKFRGKKEYFEEGVKMLEEIINIPVLGVVPYFDVKIDEEDGVSEKFSSSRMFHNEDDIKVIVIKYPNMSNYTDFEVFEHIEGVDLQYLDVRKFKPKSSELKDRASDINADIIILPGSKNTISDLRFLKEIGLFDSIKKHVDEGKMLVGICGGNQMLGERIVDNDGVDSGNGIGVIEEGFGLFSKQTHFENTKKTNQVKGVFRTETDLFVNLEGFEIKGYELHMGKDYPLDEKICEYIEKENIDKNIEKSVEENTIKNILFENSSENIFEDSLYISKGNVLGTYVHGFFDNIQFTTSLLNNIRLKKGLDLLRLPTQSFDELKMIEYDKIADVIRENIDIEKLYEMLQLG